MSKASITKGNIMGLFGLGAACAVILGPGIVRGYWRRRQVKKFIAEIAHYAEGCMGWVRHGNYEHAHKWYIAARDANRRAHDWMRDRQEWAEDSGLIALWGGSVGQTIIELRDHVGLLRPESLGGPEPPSRPGPSPSHPYTAICPECQCVWYAERRYSIRCPKCYTLTNAEEPLS